MPVRLGKVHLQIDVPEVARNWSVFASTAADGNLPTYPVGLGEQELQRRENLRFSLHEDDSIRERWAGGVGHRI